MKLFQTSFHDIIDCSDEDTYYTFRSVVNLILVVTNVHLIKLHVWRQRNVEEEMKKVPKWWNKGCGMNESLRREEDKHIYIEWKQFKWKMTSILWDNIKFTNTLPNTSTSIVQQNRTTRRNKNKFLFYVRIRELLEMRFLSSLVSYALLLWW
jgi:hypothetical protein